MINFYLNINKFLLIFLVLFIYSCDSKEVVRVTIIDKSINKDKFFNTNKVNKIEQNYKTNKIQHQNIPINNKVIVPKAITNSTWIAPLNAKVKQGFSQKNQGLTFANKSGEKVKSINDGSVVYSSDNLKTYGKMVIIKHKYGFYSHYMFNQEILVKVGDLVKQGQEIAITSKNFMHLSMKKFTTIVNPAEYINFKDI